MKPNFIGASSTLRFDFKISLYPINLVSEGINFYHYETFKYFISRLIYAFDIIGMLLILLGSCQEDVARELPEPVDNVMPRTNYFLINTIEIALNGQGDWEFVDDLETVEDQVIEIFVDRSDFAQVDEFGFDTTLLGTQYFYAVEFGVSGARTWFCFLTPGTGAISTTYGGSQVANGYDCENESCCDKCVAHDSFICTCHDINNGCMLQNPPPTPSCKKTNSTKA